MTQPREGQVRSSMATVIFFMVLTSAEVVLTTLLLVVESGCRDNFVGKGNGADKTDFDGDAD